MTPKARARERVIADELQKLFNQVLVNHIGDESKRIVRRAIRALRAAASKLKGKQ